MYKLNEKAKTQNLCVCVLNDFILCIKSFKKLNLLKIFFYKISFGEWIVFYIINNIMQNIEINK